MDTDISDITNTDLSPASNTNTFKVGSSLNREANAQPAVPVFAEKGVLDASLTKSDTDTNRHLQ